MNLRILNVLGIFLFSCMMVTLAVKFNMRHRRIQPELHWGPNEERRHEYDRFIPPLVAARLQHENPVDVARFVQNLRIILQRQRVHFDMGEGDGSHVWSWRLPPRPIDQDGRGDDIRVRQLPQPQMLPPAAVRFPNYRP